MGFLQQRGAERTGWGATALTTAQLGVLDSAVPHGAHGTGPATPAPQRSCLPLQPPCLAGNWPASGCSSLRVTVHGSQRPARTVAAGDPRIRPSCTSSGEPAGESREGPTPECPADPSPQQPSPRHSSAALWRRFWAIHRRTQALWRPQLPGPGPPRSHRARNGTWEVSPRVIVSESPQALSLSSTPQSAARTGTASPGSGEADDPHVRGTRAAKSPPFSRV